MSTVNGPFSTQLDSSSYPKGFFKDPNWFTATSTYQECTAGACSIGTGVAGCSVDIIL